MTGRFAVSEDSGIAAPAALKSRLEQLFCLLFVKFHDNIGLPALTNIIFRFLFFAILAENGVTLCTFLGGPLDETLMNLTLEVLRVRLALF